MHSSSGVSAMASWSSSTGGKGGTPVHASRPAPLLTSGVLLAEVGRGGVSGADLLDRPEPVRDHGVGDVVDRYRDGHRAKYGTTPSPSGESVGLAVGQVDADERELEVARDAEMSSPARSASATAAATPASAWIGL